MVDTVHSTNITFEAGTGANYGLIHASQNGVMDIGDNWVNEPGGVITADKSSILNFEGIWLNSGTVNLDATSTLDLNGTVNLANLGTLNDTASSIVNILGMLDNTSPISAPAYTGTWYLNGGTITGGSIASSANTRALSLSNGQSFYIQSGTLDDVSITGGDLNLSDPNTNLSIADGTSIATRNLNVNNNGISVTLLGTQILDNLNLKFNVPAASPVTSLNIGKSGNSGAITFGPNLIVRGGNFQIGHVSGAFANYGTVDANSLGNPLIIQNTFTNNGTLQATLGGLLQIDDTISNAGTLSAGFSSSITVNGKITGAGSTFVTGSLTANGITQTSLIVAGPGTAMIRPKAEGGENSVVNQLSFVYSGAGTGQLDITDNSLTIPYTGASPLTEIQGDVAMGYDAGKWDGRGITSSAAASRPGTAIGLMDDGSQVLVQYTWYGDTNLDGVVNSLDITTVHNDMGQSNLGWAGGDFNYDGVVNADDFSLMQLGIAEQTGKFPTALPEPPIAFLALSAFALRSRPRHLY